MLALTRRHLVLSGATAALAAPASARVPRPLSIDDALAMKSPGATLSAISISPDGRLAAFSVQDAIRAAEVRGAFTPTGAPSDVAGCDLWLSDLTTMRAAPITNGEGNNWGSAWSPDGNTLAFLSDRDGAPRLWAWDRATHTSRRVSPVITRMAEARELIRWSVDGRRLFVKLLPEGVTVASAARDLQSMLGTDGRQRAEGEPSAVVFVHQPNARAAPDRRDDVSFGAYGATLTADLGAIDFATGEVERLASNMTTQWWALSPLGRELAFTRMVRYETPATYQRLFELVIIDLRTSQVRVVASDVRQILDPFVAWAPNGQALAYATAGPLATGDCYVVGLDGAPPRNVTAEAGLGPGPEMRPPLWSANSDAIHLVAQDRVWRFSLSGDAPRSAALPGRTLRDLAAPADAIASWPSNPNGVAVVSRDEATRNEGVWIVDLNGGQATLLVEGAISFGAYPRFGMAIHAQSGRLIYTAQSARAPPDLFTIAQRTRGARRISTCNDRYAQYRLGGSVLIEWQGPEGRPLYGALLLPPEFRHGHPVPMVIDVYGGASLSRQLNQFGLGAEHGAGIRNRHLLATRGIAVLAIDSVATQGAPMQAIAACVEGAADRAIDLGFADPDCLGVMGESYGGYSVMSVIVATTRFRAALCQFGYANLFTQYATMSPDGARNFSIAWNEEGRGGMGASPWQERQRYIDNSPFFRLDRVDTALMLVAGEEDYPFLSDEIFTSLRRLEKEVIYVRYGGEGHGLRSIANQHDFCQRMLSWFGERLARD